MPLPTSSPEGRPIGPTMVRNLYRLGHAEIVVRSTELSKLVGDVTGRPISRQRISAMMNAVRVEPETIEQLAKAIGVHPSELTRPVEIHAVVGEQEKPAIARPGRPPKAAAKAGRKRAK